MHKASVMRVRIGLAVAAVLALAGCREAEKERPLSFTPHVYSGDKLPTLTEQQKRNLQDRGNLQR